MRSLILTLSLLGLTLSGAAQHEHRADSLRQGLQNASTDSMKWSYALDLVIEYLNVDLDSARKYAQLGIDFAKQGQLIEEEAKAYDFMGSVYNYKGEIEPSLQYYLKALAISDSLGLEKMQGQTHGNLGLLYSEAMDHNKALFHLKQAIAYNSKLDLQKRVANNLNTVGLVYLNQSRYDSAEYYFLEALPVFQKLNNQSGLSAIWENLGIIKYNLEEYEAALNYYEKAFEIDKVLGDKRYLSISYLNLGKVYHAMGQPEKAIEYYKEGILISEELGSIQRLAKLYDRISQSYSATGDYKNAYEYYRQFFILQDSMSRAQHNETVAKIETEYKTREQENRLKEQASTIARQKDQQRLTFIGSALLIVLLFALFQYFRYRYRIRRRESELALQLEKAEAEKLREMDQLKSNFFANISHEFRTPLTIILGPLDQMIKGTFKGNREKYFRIMYRNGQRLLGLVNQLLDLSRLESGRMTLQETEGNLLNFIRAIAYSFESMAERKQISYTIDVPEENCHVWFDRDKLEKILTNLLSNAFKFTKEEGQITVSTNLSKEGEDLRLQLRVKDSGIGIPEDQIKHIFDRFYTVNESDLEMGSSGIGLALTKELVELHGGKIWVESKEGLGSTFFIEIPLKRASGSVESISEYIPETIHKKKKEAAKIPTGIPLLSNSDRPLILVIEDNEDVRNFIADELDNYRLIEAENGQIGLEKAIAEVPDLIISDVMMPVMDGMELCSQLKQNSCTSHIPVIMLTAKAEQEDKLEGLETGADDYLTKPFDARELQVRISNLIEQRQRLRSFYQKTTSFKPESVAVTSLDEQFLQKVKSEIEANMDEERFSVVELSSLVSMSRSQLHRKLKALTGRSPNQIIRDMRLLRAKELLEKGAGNASEVAFMVGFNSLAYFSKCFSDAFGHSPSDVKTQAR